MSRQGMKTNLAPQWMIVVDKPRDQILQNCETGEEAALGGF